MLMRKYNPEDFSWDIEIQSSMEKIYHFVENDKLSKEEYFLMEDEIWNLHILLKHAVVNHCMEAGKAKEIEEYFWGLLL